MKNSGPFFGYVHKARKGSRQNRKVNDEKGGDKQKSKPCNRQRKQDPFQILSV